MANNWPGAVNRVLGAALTHFGEAVTYAPAAAPANLLPIEGIFNEVWREVEPDGAVVSSNQPNLGVRLADFPDGPPMPEDTFVIRSTVYKAVDVQEDGEGGAKILLHKVDA